MRVNALVTLDSILDTRLAFLFNTDKGVLEKLLTSGDWHRRKHDRFITGKNFHELFANRDETALRGAPMTKVLRLLQEFKLLNTMVSDENPVPKDPGLIINYYPYTLSEQEVQGIRYGISEQSTIPLDRVELVRHSKEECDVSFIEDNHIDFIVDYEAVLWLDALAAAGKFKKKAFPSVTVIAPMVDDRPFVAPIANATAEVDPFEALEFMASPFASLQFYPVEIFCIVK